MKTDYIKKHGSKDVIEAAKQMITANQEGGAAPEQQAVAPQEQAPQEGQANPEEMLMAFIEAMNAEDKAEATQIALQFTTLLAQDYMAQQQQAQGTPAMRKGGVAENKKMSFSKDGSIKK